uniref:hypothetical protein n=1 Tax=Psychrobacter sp. TaxID=56811 RepID=UPI001599CD5B|nr:hypothetical protein [Psychrobacter sp.]QJS05707.1 mobilization protein MobC [Psychrobacter sp.]
MNVKDIEYLRQLVNRFSGFNSPTDTQKLLIALGNKKDRTAEDDKKVSILLKAEKKAEELHTARQKARDLVGAEKQAARKLETRKKVIWGSALKTASISNPKIAQLMRKLYDEGYVSDKDKDAVKGDYEAIPSSSIP